MFRCLQQSNLHLFFCLLGLWDGGKLYFWGRFGQICSTCLSLCNWQLPGSYSSIGCWGKSERTEPLKASPLNCHPITSATFTWTKSVRQGCLSRLMCVAVTRWRMQIYNPITENWKFETILYSTIPLWVNVRFLLIPTICTCACARLHANTHTQHTWAQNHLILTLRSRWRKVQKGINVLWEVWAVS